MPRKVDLYSEHTKRWNFYVNELEKLDYIMALTKAGKSRCQSAGLRAFMYAYTNNELVRNEINKIIDDFVIYTDNDKLSKM